MSVRRDFLPLVAAGLLAIVGPPAPIESAGVLRRAYCDNITANDITRLLKAVKAENAARDCSHSSDGSDSNIASASSHSPRTRNG